MKWRNILFFSGISLFSLTTSSIALITLNFNNNLSNQANLFQANNPLKLKRIGQGTFENPFMIDITNGLDPTLKLTSLYEIYYNDKVFDNLRNALLNNQTFLTNSVNNPNLTLNYYKDSNGVVDEVIKKSIIKINKTNDEQRVIYGDVVKTMLDKKNINGRLTIDVNFLDITTQNIVSYTYILCGFKRDQPSLFIDYSKENIGYQLYNAINNNRLIVLKNNIPDVQKQLLKSNIFYYHNYNDPLQSEFLNIDDSFIQYQSQNKITIINKKFDKNFNVMFDKDSKIIFKEEFGSINFTQQTDFLLNNTSLLVIIIIASIIGLIIVVLIICYFVKGQRLRQN